MNKKLTYRIFSIFLGIGIIAGLIIYAGTSELLELLSQTSLTLLFLSILVSLFAWLFRALFLKIHTKIKFANCFRIICIGYMLNAILPAKAGDINMIYSLKQKGVSLVRSVNILIHYRIMDLFSLLVISLPLLLIYMKNKIPENIIHYLVIIGAIITIPALILVDRNGLISKLLLFLEEKISINFLKKFINKSHRLYSDYEILLKTKKRWSALISFSGWLVEGLVSYIIAIAIGYPISLYIIFLAVSLGNISKVIPITPGGIGVYETTVMLLLSIFGIPTQISTLLAILDHAIKTALGIILGSISLIFSESKNPLKREA